MILAKRFSLGCVLGVAILVADGGLNLAKAQTTDTPPIQDADAGAIIVTGTRGRDRTASSSPVPVDVLSGSDLRASGAVSNELGQALATVTPSFNFPRQSNSGTSDHLRTGQLRGLSPDQMLVLVNGRRRHNSSIVNSETKIGRGAAAVDFNTIPLGAVKRVEVLRDGAGAQYGSDAVAGVVNVLLDDRPHGGELTITYGAHATHLDPIDGAITDGETKSIDASWGAPLGEGFIRVGGDYQNRAATNRAGFDQIPFFVAQTPANLALQGKRNYAEGDPKAEAWNLWLNAQTQVGDIELYGFGTFGRRDTLGATFFRYPDSSENVRAIYPNGYRPLSSGENEDFSVTSGARGELAGWKTDASLTYGGNKFRYGAKGSLNASLGAESPTSFHSGTYQSDQLTANLDIIREVPIEFLPQGLTLAAGLEFRRETYDTRRGDDASFAAGSFNGAIGAQGALGLTPEDEIRLTREVWSIYADASGDVTDRLFVDVAARFEHYSDFGDQSTGKVAALYRLTDQLSLRGAISNSLRAPALQQSGYSDTTLNFGANRSLVRTRTLPTSNPISTALGILPLKPETSSNFSAGAIARFSDHFNLSLDIFRIEVQDRITLSERFFGASVENFVQSQPGGGGIQSVRFFTNAVDTRTQGVDLSATYNQPLADGALVLSLGYTYAQTNIEDFAPTPSILLSLDHSFRLVGVEEVNTIEDAAPRQKLIGSASWTNETWRLFGRISHYGSAVRVFNFGGGFEPRQRYGSETQVDAEVEYKFNEHAAFTVGASNLLDEYPDKSPSDINFFGNLPYDILSPIGVNGRFVYGRLRLTF